MSFRCADKEHLLPVGGEDTHLRHPLELSECQASQPRLSDHPEPLSTYRHVNLVMLCENLAQLTRNLGAEQQLTLQDADNQVCEVWRSTVVLTVGWMSQTLYMICARCNHYSSIGDTVFGELVNPVHDGTIESLVVSPDKRYHRQNNLQDALSFL